MDTDVLKKLEDACTGIGHVREIIACTDLVALRGDRTQTDIALKADVSQSTVCRLERGNTRHIGNETLVRLLRVYLEGETCPS